MGLGKKNKDQEDAERDFGLVEPVLDDEPIVPHRKRRLFIACACILGNELCERLAYYGLQTNMGLYLKKYMGYPADQASQLLQVWKATVYLTPLLGAYLADAYLGRFWVILIFSTIYFVGLLGITLVNIIPSMQPQFEKPPANGYGPSRAMFWAFMYLVALGSGGIKPCVSSFGGDQFKEESARERKWRSSFFNWFYFSINVGSLVATLVVVPVQENQGYGIGFGIPTIAFAIAIGMFILGAVFKMYTVVPPGGSPITRIFRVLAGGWKNRKKTLPSNPRELYEPAEVGKGAMTVNFRMIHTEGMKSLDKAAIKATEPVKHQVSVTEVEETKAFLRLMPIFACVIIWQMCYDPIFTLLPYPGDVMDRKMGSFTIPASSISFANTFGVLFMVTFYDMVIVPLTNKMNRPISMTTRIGIGFIVAILALASAALIEMGRYKIVEQASLKEKWEADTNPDKSPTDPQYTEPMSIWYQAIPYFLLGAAEAFTNVGVMELFYTQVSVGMRALGTSFYLLTVAIGTYLATALNIIIGAISPNDPWVANNPIYGHYDWYFWVNVVILFLAFIAYIFVARAFVEKPIMDVDADPFNLETRVASEMANVSKTWPSVRRSSRLSELRMRSAASMSASSGGLPTAHRGSAILSQPPAAHAS